MTPVRDLPSSVEAFLAGLPEQWRDHPLAWACRELAKDVTRCDPEKSASLVRELRIALAELRSLAPVAAEDKVSEIARQRAARRARAAAR